MQKYNLSVSPFPSTLPLKYEANAAGVMEFY